MTRCARLSTAELASIQSRVTHSFVSEGITFTVYGGDEAEERIIPIDCVPRIVLGRTSGGCSRPGSPSACGR